MCIGNVGPTRTYTESQPLFLHSVSTKTWRYRLISEIAEWKYIRSSCSVSEVSVVATVPQYCSEDLVWMLNWRRNIASGEVVAGPMTLDHTNTPVNSKIIQKQRKWQEKHSEIPSLRKCDSRYCVEVWSCMAGRKGMRTSGQSGS